MKVAGFQKTSLIDYPGRISSVVFTLGCNLRCPYCHNWRIVKETAPFITEEEILRMLLSRARYIDSIVVTGGEPTIQPDLPLFLRKLKNLNFHVKLDTNGLKPEVLERCLPYVDYVALDVKTTLKKYRLLGAVDPSPLLKTIDLLKNSGVDYEFRCTVVPKIIDPEDLGEFAELVKGAKLLALQQFNPEDPLDPAFKAVKPYTREGLLSIGRRLMPYVKRIEYRFSVTASSH